MDETRDCAIACKLSDVRVRLGQGKRAIKKNIISARDYSHDVVVVVVVIVVVVVVAIAADANWAHRKRAEI